ncbi:MAG: beta/gamma crystallin family protein [Scytonema hyalinum WJT4-NPBG1]|nr:beta/gamma crystallin family protein [Scytonema hyalinum WJT4-NPBG1]
MKDKQLFTELTAEFEAPVTELDDEVAATCSGGAAIDIYFGGPNPDVILYDKENRGLGDALQINAKAFGGDDNLDNSAIGSGWNNKTSSIQVIRGNWVIYQDSGKGRPSKVILTPNGGPKKDGVYPNAKAFGLPDNSLTGIFRTNV